MSLTIKPLFASTLFSATRFKTAEDKAAFADRLVAFMLAGFPHEAFTDDFYRTLSKCRGHIAHYDRGGFYAEWFASADKQAEFVSHWVNTPIYGHPSHTFSDVEHTVRGWLLSNFTAVQAVIENNGKAERAAEDAEDARRAALKGKATQAYVVAAKSENTNSFGLHQYIVVAEDGTAFKLLKSMSFPMAVGEVLNPVLYRGLPDWSRHGIECPKRIPQAPAKVVKEAWEKASRTPTSV